MIRGPETARRQAELGIIAEMQPYHTIDDMRWMELRIGGRGRWAYAFRTLHDAGGPPLLRERLARDQRLLVHGEPAGRDLRRRHPADAERRAGGRVVPEERIDVETALKAYTVNNAWVAGEEDRKGMVKEGFLADLAVLEQNPFEVEPLSLKDVQVDYTVVGGRVVWER